MIPDDETSQVDSHQLLRAPRNSIKEMGHKMEVQHPTELKEAVEVTVLRELGGSWDVYELPATRSVRSSKGGKSVKSLKGGKSVKSLKGVR